MTNRLTTIMMVFVLLGVGLLFLLNLTPIFQTPVKEKYLARDLVNGVEVVHNKLPYTLNFEQQNGLVTLLNEAETIKAGVPTSSLDFDKIIIYVFNAPNIEIYPIAYVGDDLVFSVPAWDKVNFMKDSSHGELKKLISQTYDP
jgi:hypothetical protein